MSRIGFMCAFIETMGEVGFALLGEADAQVETPRSIIPLLLYCLVLTPSERNHEPSIPMRRAQISH